MPIFSLKKNLEKKLFLLLERKKKKNLQDKAHVESGPHGEGKGKKEYADQRG